MTSPAVDGPQPLVPRRWWALAAVQLLVVIGGALAVPGLRHPAPAVSPPGAAATPATSTSRPPAETATPAPSARDETAAVSGIKRALQGRDRALLGRDRRIYLAAAQPRTAGARAAAALYVNLAEVPVSEWTEAVDARSVAAVPGAPGSYTVSVVRRYRLRGFDPGGVAQERRLTMVRSGAKWLVAADARAPGERGELWEGGPVVVRRGASSIVLAHRSDAGRLASYTQIADVAVRNVTSVWGTHWSQRVVVIVPTSTVELGRVLDSTADYAQIAALATADIVDTAGLRTALADRVVINPGTFGRLTALGQRIVMTHEVTHVASRLATGKASPSWLVEGFADYVAYRTNYVPTRVAARDLTPAVRRGPLPTMLPTDAQFDPAAADLGASYELAWLACRYLAERTTESKLLQFYRAVGAATGSQDEAVRHAFAAVLAATPESFTASWRVYVAAAVS